MKKLFSFLAIMCLISTSFGQPTKVAPVKSLFQGYSPSKCVDCINVIQQPVIKKDYITKRIVDPVKYREPINCSDSIIINNDISIYNYNKDTVIYLEDKKDYLDIVNYQQELLNNVKDNLLVYKYRQSGLTKILSGIGCQIVGVGLIAYANIPMYDTRSSTNIQEVEYTYPVYELVPDNTITLQTKSAKCTNVNYHPKIDDPLPINNVPSTIEQTQNQDQTQTQTQTQETNVDIDITVDPTINNYVIFNSPKYKLHSYDKTGVMTIMDVDQVTYKKERNKTGYYIGAGILGGVGVLLEVWGICDYHKAHIYSNSNSLGLQVKF